MDADGFDAFKEAGNVFDPELAARLRREVYEVGNTRDPAESYRAFRGRMPTADALLRNRGPSSTRSKAGSGVVLTSQPPAPPRGRSSTTPPASVKVSSRPSR